MPNDDEILKLLERALIVLREVLNLLTPAQVSEVNDLRARFERLRSLPFGRDDQ